MLCSVPYYMYVAEPIKNKENPRLCQILKKRKKRSIRMSLYRYPGSYSNTNIMYLSFVLEN